MMVMCRQLVTQAYDSGEGAGKGQELVSFASISHANMIWIRLWSRWSEQRKRDLGKPYRVEILSRWAKKSHWSEQGAGC